jgi:hypothetical protein
MDDFLNSEG